jgi:hypothetical protein
MTAYLQMGHDTENLVGETDLEEFRGIILSPVNRPPDKLRESVPIFRQRGDYDIILDPQLYVPRAQRENLNQQPYFPDAFDTSDFSMPQGWTSVVNDLARFAKQLGIDGVASPVIMPRRWTDEFYDTCVETSHMLSQALDSCRVLTTCLVSLADMVDSNRARQIASILTRHDTKGFYVVLDSEIEPRRELTDADGLLTFMSLISLLQRYAPVTVAFSYSDMLLYKAAGATNCATSKFFNLRRFTMSRFDEPPAGGGGQLPYWFEHNLLAFIREADIRRLQRDGYRDIIGGSYSNSRSGRQVLDFLTSNPGDSWLGKSWRQYLSWFGKTEQEVSAEGIGSVREWLKAAERNWQQLDEDEVLMDEPRNDGSWIRPWRQALRDFNRP